MIASLKQVLHRGARTDEFCECRLCGTTVERPESGCPACGSSEIARYSL